MYISSFYEKYEERINDVSYMTTVIRNYIISIIILVPIFFLGVFKTGFPMLKNIIISLLAIDTVYFFTHYISHIVPFIKNSIHHKHHTLIDKLLPLDTLYLDSIDYIIYAILTFYLPFLFIENSLEYGILLFISVIHSLYLHSDIDSEFIIPFFISAKFHTLHHTHGTGNFSVFFTHWDDYMRTRINEKPASSSIKHMTHQEFKNECVKGRKLTIIGGEVFDCTSWIDIHPGGKSVIENIIGNDSTDDFNRIHGNTKTAKEMLKTLKIADIYKEL